MDVTKFLWILQNNALYFARCDMLGDPFEGHYTRPYGETLETMCAARGVGTKPENLVLTDAEKRKLYSYAQTRSIVKQLKLQYYVNCWHLNEVESGAMWKLYTSMNDAVCIRSSYDVLAKWLPSDAFFGVVKYVDYEQDTFGSGNVLEFIMHKRLSFEHEREARSVIWCMASESQHREFINDRHGMSVAIDTKELIKEIYLSPSANAPLLEVVTKLVKDFGLNIEVKQSEVNSPPAY